MIHTTLAALTDGQYWGLCIMGALIAALACGLVGCAAEQIMGDRA